MTYDISPVSVDFICNWLSKVLLSCVSVEGLETEYLSLYSLSLILSEVYIELPLISVKMILAGISVLKFVPEL